VEARDFSLFHSVQTGSGAHPTSNPKGTRALSPGLISSAEIKNAGAIPPLPTRLHGVVLNLLRTGNNLLSSSSSLLRKNLLHNYTSYRKLNTDLYFK
jgi:hypothetical protein